METGQTIFYSFPSCNHSRQVREWLKVNKVGYVERKVLREPIGREEILGILRLTTEGFDEIVSEKNFNSGDIAESMEDLKISQLMDFICENPSLLKKPILIYEGKLVIGWNKNKYREISMSMNK